MELQNKAPELKPITRDRPLALSFAQERLWLLEQLNPNTTTYNIPLAFQIEGNLNKDLLEKSLQQVIQRHEVLRTNFSLVDNQPIQIVREISRFQLELAEVGDDSVTELINQAAQEPFNLATDSLIRGALIKVKSDEFILVLTIHHIIWDGWSESILFKEVAALYDSYLTKQEPDLPELAIQYADYAAWQKQWLQGEILTFLESYWQEQLKGNLQELQLPTDKVPTPKPTGKSKIQQLELSEELQAGLKALSRQEGATIFPTLLAAFYVLLYHYTEQEDLVVCSPTANRNRKVLKSMTGYFVNLLVLRGDLTDNPSFRDLLAQVKQTATSANAHQDLPLQKLVNCLDGMEVPLSQVLFALQNTPQQCLELTGSSVTRMEGIEGTADFDLFLSLEAKTLKTTLTYNSDLFTEEFIKQFLQRWQTILEQIVAHPECSVTELLPLSEAEKSQLRQQRKPTQPTVLEKTPTSKDSEGRLPKDALELQLTQIWQQVLGVNSVGVTDNFFELGGESLLALRLLSQIEQKLGQTIPLTRLIQAPKIAELADLLREDATGTTWTSLVPLQTGKQNNPSLFCVAPAGITALSFAELANCLGTEQPFYVLQAQGLDDARQPAHTTIEAMVEHYISEILTVQPESPYLIAGMCFGNLVAFELARQLQLRGKEVKLVAMFDPFNLASTELVSPRTFGLSFSYHTKVLALLEGKAKLDYLYSKVDRAVRKLIYKTYQKFNLPLNSSLRGFYFQQLSDVIRSKYQAEPFAGKVTLMLASQRPHSEADTVEELQAGWSTLATKGVEVKEYFGHHQLTLQEPCVSSLAKQLEIAIDSVTS